MMLILFSKKGSFMSLLKKLQKDDVLNAKQLLVPFYKGSDILEHVRLL